MKLKKMLAVALLAMSAMGFQIVNAQSLSPSSKWHWDKGTIVIDTPERPAGQEHVLGLTAAPIKTVRVGFVGLGMRGPSAVIRFCQIPGVEICCASARFSSLRSVTMKKSVPKHSSVTSATQVWLRLPSIMEKRDMRNSASVRTWT